MNRRHTRNFEVPVSPGSRFLGADEGFSLIEIIVAMFVLAGLTLALAPALIAGIKQTAQNAIVASATHQLSSQMDLARLQTATCQAVTVWANQTVPNYVGGQVTAGNGVTLQTVKQLGACPATYPGTVPLTVSIKRLDTNATVVNATSLIYLQSAN